MMTLSGVGSSRALSNSDGLGDDFGPVFDGGLGEGGEGLVVLPVLGGELEVFLELLRLPGEVCSIAGERLSWKRSAWWRCSARFKASMLIFFIKCAK